MATLLRGDARKVRLRNFAGRAGVPARFGRPRRQTPGMSEGSRASTCRGPGGARAALGLLVCGPPG